MKLVQIQVTDYKSIRQSNPVPIGDVTCMVGRNESGKTALLEALYKLNPIVPEHSKFDVTEHYPRADVEDYRQQIETEKIEPTTVIRATFNLEPNEIAEIEAEFGKGVLTAPTYFTYKRYDNNGFYQMSVDESVAVKHLVDEYELPEKIAKDAKNQATLAALKSHLTAKVKEANDAVANAKAAANALEDDAKKSKALAAALKHAPHESLAPTLERLEVILKEQNLRHYIYKNYIQSWDPKYLYFDEYYQMEGSLNVESLLKRQKQGTLLDSDRPMLGLIELARLDVQKLISTDRTEDLLSRLEGASNHLSRKILEYWSQNKHLQVRFDIRPARAGDPPGMQEGTNLLGRVNDSVHSVTTPLGSRSKGFIWFFSFLAWFSQQTKSKQPLILLLDEPGLFLHAKAQSDLLRYIEAELQPHHQVIYTTHSPFMVDPQRFDRVRIVEDRSTLTDGQLPIAERGTKVFSEVLEANEGTLFPLQGALGYDICQTLFVGSHCLIVEGVSDYLYLQAISGILERAGKVALDQQWTITPVGGSDKVPTFVALLGAQKAMKLATLIDIQKKDTQRIEQLYTRKLLQKKNTLTFADFTGKAESDIEDMFDPDFYLSLVNGEYGTKIELTDLPQTEERILVRLEKYFADSPLTGAKFNHYRPSRYLVDKLDDLEANISADTLTRFENAAKALNKLV